MSEKELSIVRMFAPQPAGDKGESGLTEVATHLNGGWDQETGAPSAALLGDAIQVWAILQRRDVTVSEAALAFNASIQVVATTARQHPWMFLRGEASLETALIEHEGE